MVLPCVEKFTIGWVTFIFLVTVFLPWFLGINDLPKSGYFFCFLSVIAVLAIDWMAVIHDSQFAPHHVVQKVGQHVTADFWTTNNIWISYTSEFVPSTNGLSFRTVRHTNEYWHIWKIFQK
jgi:hypothetical protein